MHQLTRSVRGLALLLLVAVSLLMVRGLLTVIVILALFVQNGPKVVAVVGAPLALQRFWQSSPGLADDG